MVSTNYTKLKTNLRLSVQRLKLLGKKKNELAQKSRREIGAFLANNKIERAKIRVEQIIREDYLVEALEIVEMYCDLLLARFGLIEQIKTLDDGLAEAVASIIWVANRIDGCQELKVVADILSHKYGKEYAQAARTNSLNKVNDKLIHKMSIETPPKLLVEQYLIGNYQHLFLSLIRPLIFLKIFLLLSMPLLFLFFCFILEIAKTLNIPYHAAEVWEEHEKEKEKQKALKDEDFMKFDEGSAPSLPSVPPNADNSKILHPIGFKVISNVTPITVGPSAPILPPYSSGDSNKSNQGHVSTNSLVKPLKPGFIDVLHDLPDVPTGLPNLESSKDSANKDDPIDFDDLGKRFDALKKRK